MENRIIIFHLSLLYHIHIYVRIYLCNYYFSSEVYIKCASEHPMINIDFCCGLLLLSTYVSKEEKERVHNGNNFYTWLICFFFSRYCLGELYYVC